MPAFLWDCSVHVNRKEQKVNFPQYVSTIMACYPERKVIGNGGDNGAFEEETAFEAASHFGPGINLGNTLDATSYSLAQEKSGEDGWIVKWGAKDRNGNYFPADWETAWGQPETTQNIADYILSLGFNAIRIPVTWAEHLDENDQVDPIWMERVKHTVDYFYNRGAYCIVNVHHDGGADGWIEATEASYQQYGTRFAALWAQIAETFAEYDERLLFESMNEVLDDRDNWGSPSQEASQWINEWNQLFVSTVRACGGYNDKRNLVVMTYSGGGSDQNFRDFSLPQDSADHHLLITVHNYDPQGFTWTNATWTKMTAKWSDTLHGNVLRREFEVYKKYMDQFGAPIVLGEYNADPKLYADYDQ